MSNLRNKASEVYAKGVDQRGEFTPTGVPLRMWKYWAANTKPGRVPVRENFCHFWRVVALWAPLAWLRVNATNAVNNAGVQIAVGAFLLIALVYAAVTLPSVLMGVFIVLGICLGLMAGIAGVLFAAGIWETDEVVWDAPWEKYVAGALAVLGLPAALLAFGIAGLAFNWKKEWNDPILATLLTIAGLAIAGVAAFTLVQAFIAVGWILAVYIVGAAAAVFGVVAALSGLATFISGKRALAKERRDQLERDRYLQYQNGLLTYEEYYGHARPKPRTPGKFELKVKAFFSGLADFLILVFQIVRVNKWKICPTVEVK